MPATPPFSSDAMSGSACAAPGWYSRLHLKDAAALKAELATKMLTKAYCGPEHAVLERVTASGADAALKRFRGAHLVGFGFGAKVSENKLTGDLAIRVYVTGKRDNDKLSRWQRIPKEINGVPTDVVPVPRPKLHELVRPGTGIRRQPEGSSVGSLGFVVEQPETGKWFLVTAAHVIAPDGAAAKGDPIVENNNPAQVLATLHDFEPLKFGQPNIMDAAIAEIVDKTQIGPAIPKIGPVAESHQASFIYQSVRKFGSATRHTLGVVVDAIPSIILGTLSYEGLVCVQGCATHFSEGGDSGAVVVDAISHKPIGIVTGGGGFMTFITPISRIVSHRMFTDIRGRLIS